MASRIRNEVNAQILQTVAARLADADWTRLLVLPQTSRSLYVALLFTHFIPCGVWEAAYIIEGLLRNASEAQPKTVHADTQGQSYPIFTLAHLMGFVLMPTDEATAVPDEYDAHLDIDFDVLGGAA